MTSHLLLSNGDGNGKRSVTPLETVTGFESAQAFAEQRRQ